MFFYCVYTHCVTTTILLLDPNNFLKGLDFSPDGTCLLSCSEDNILRVYEVEPILTSTASTATSTSTTATSIEEDYKPVLISKEGETVYDYCWYKHMASSDPITCVYASTSRDNPIHLWDAYFGSLRATYSGESSSTHTVVQQLLFCML